MLLWQLSPIWPRLLVFGNQSASEATLIKGLSGEWRADASSCGLLCVVRVMKIKHAS